MKSQLAEKGFELHEKCSCFASFYVYMSSNPEGSGVREPEIRVPVAELCQEELRHPVGAQSSVAKQSHQRWWSCLH